MNGTSGFGFKQAFVCILTPVSNNGDTHTNKGSSVIQSHSLKLLHDNTFGQKPEQYLSVSFNQNQVHCQELKMNLPLYFGA